MLALRLGSWDELFFVSKRLVHHFGLEYFHLNLSLVVATYIFRNYGSGSRPQLQLNMAWNHPQILILQTITILARGNLMSLFSSQSVIIMADSNFIHSLFMIANCGLRSSMTSSVGNKNSMVSFHISYCLFDSSTNYIVHLSHYSLIALSAYLFFANHITYTSLIYTSFLFFQNCLQNCSISSFYPPALPFVYYGYNMLYLLHSQA